MAQQTRRKPTSSSSWATTSAGSTSSCYNHGMMGYRRPTSTASPRKARCSPTGMASRAAPPDAPPSSPGSRRSAPASPRSACPGATIGLQAEDPTIAEFLKPLGYATGQFGKNHLGDKNEFLPTVHGFDEFFGNLYHLNAEEEPEYPTTRRTRASSKMFGPRGVLKCKATDKDDTTVQPRVRPRRQADDRGHRPAHQEAHGDGRRGVHGRRARLHGSQDQGGQAVVLLVQHHAHARLHAPEAGVAGQDGPRPLPGWHGRARRLCRPAPREARRARHRRQHHRRLHHRQWRRGVVLAGRRRDAVPRRERHQLGRRLPRAVRHPLARRDRARHGHQRDLRPRGPAPDLRGGGRRARPRREGEEGLQVRRQDLQGPPRRLQPDALPSRARTRNRRARSSSTGATTASSAASAL